MGAWGIGIFQDDMALDILDEIAEFHNPYQYIVKAIEQALVTEYLGYEDCFKVLVSAALIDIEVNNRIYDAIIESYYDLLNDLKQYKLEVLKSKAKKALAKVISQKSELNELWNENQEEYLLWSSNIKGLITRLS